MSHVSYPFKKTNKAVYQKPTTEATADANYWKNLGSSVLIKEFGAIDYLDFCPQEPYYFAATCSVRVQVYNPITKLVTKNISKFVQAAYGGSYRGDGRMLVAGSEESVVKLFDVHSKNVLRVFTGHTAPVHRTFFTKDQVKVISFSDDKTVALWDIPTEAKIANFVEHTDYVRAGAASPVSPDLILSGGYDHIVKLYDCRSNETILTVNHGSPVESTLFLPSGGIFISAGGTEIKVWDIFNGGKLLSNISQHHKTVTTLRLACNNSRLMSASLDRHVKIYDITNFNVVHTIDYPNAVLSMAISANDEVLAVGMVDGVISLRKRDQVQKTSDKKVNSYKFAPDHVDEEMIKPVQETPTPRKKGKTKVGQSEYEYRLRKLEYTHALKEVLKPYVRTKSPENTLSLLHELLRRQTIHSAISGLDSKFIGHLLKFCIDNIGISRYTRTVIDTANAFVDVFDTQVKTFEDSNIVLYKRLAKQINNEVEVCKRVCEIEGYLGLLLSGAHINDPSDIEIINTLSPSSKAQKDLIIDV